MCIFSQPISTVADTKIFGRLSGLGTQFLVYQMNYESVGPNSMILPLPVKTPASEDSLKFINLKEYDNFFTDLAEGFPHYWRLSLGCSGPHEDLFRRKLQVFEVGNYIASFVPSLSAFDRLDPRFSLPLETWDKIPIYKNYSFAVFQLTEGALTPHPMALEFATATDNLFFPTVHIHDGEVHETEHFDHQLFMQHAGLDSQVHGYDNSDSKDYSTGLTRSKYAARHFCDIPKASGILDGRLLVHYESIQGIQPNVDRTYRIPGDPLKPTLNLRSWLNSLPWIIALGGLGWFIERRARIAKSKTTTGKDQ